MTDEALHAIRTVVGKIINALLRNDRLWRRVEKTCGMLGFDNSGYDLGKTRRWRRSEYQQPRLLERLLETHHHSNPLYSTLNRKPRRLFQDPYLTKSSDGGLSTHLALGGEVHALAGVCNRQSY